MRVERPTVMGLVATGWGESKLIFFLHLEISLAHRALKLKVSF